MKRPEKTTMVPRILLYQFRFAVATRTAVTCGRPSHILLPLPRSSILSSFSAVPSAVMPRRHYSLPFDPQPSPPRLPPDQQAEFERLLRKTGIMPPSSLDKASPEMLEEAARTAESAAVAASATEVPNENREMEEIKTETSSGGVFRGAAPEFEGDVNPKTGEVGGPKNEPLRWGSRGDWSYNGRVTDF